MYLLEGIGLIFPLKEAHFYLCSLRVRPTRCASRGNIKQKSKYVLDADIKGCFDHIDHQALLEKWRTYPARRQLVKGWLKAGVMDGVNFSPTQAGTPQGGVGALRSA